VDFAAVAIRVTDFLGERGFRAALVGGVGLAAYGLSRTTLDLDLATDRAAQEPLVAFLESLGYETLHRSEGYSNHLHADPSLGRVDFVYVTGETADRLFADCRSVPGPAGRPFPVASPEHLAAMKVLAIKNDPSRLHQDLADLRFLLSLPGVDRAQVRQYFERHGLLDRFEELVAGL
jgi:hypothetical protein